MIYRIKILSLLFLTLLLVILSMYQIILPDRGDTYFYDKEHKIIDSVTPKENRAVLFDGSMLHSSSKPIKFPRRIVLNINLVDKKNYEISGQLSLFGRDNLDFKTVNLAKGQKFVNLCRVFKIKKIIYVIFI